MNNFRTENGRIDWNSLLLHIYESGGTDTKPLKEWAEEFNVHLNHLTYRYKSFEGAFEFALKKDLFGYTNTLTRRELNIKKEQAKLALLRKEVNKGVKELAFVEQVMEEYIKPTIKPIKLTKYTSAAKVTSKGEQLFFITDLHYLDDEHSYSIKDIGEMIIDNWDGSAKINVVFGGDYIENIHHKDQQLYTAKAMEQAERVGYVLGEALAQVLANTEATMEVYHIVGNHDGTRQGQEKSGENLREHVVNIIESIVRLSLANYKDRFKSNRACYELIKTFGDKKMNFRHGHLGHISDKALMGKMLDDELQTGKTFDHYVVGHFHRWNDWTKKGTLKRFTICPSMKTYDGNFENANIIRSTVGITRFDESGLVSFVPWKGKKKLQGDLRN